jgi:creatinine amidohydrolase/Fe(II)-dependent formamide hydrolase-like protein
MPIQVDGVLVHAMSGTELSRVRTELHQLSVLPTVPPHPVQPHSESPGHSHLGNVPLPAHR